MRSPSPHSISIGLESRLGRARTPSTAGRALGIAVLSAQESSTRTPARKIELEVETDERELEIELKW